MRKLFFYLLVITAISCSNNDDTKENPIEDTDPIGVDPIEEPVNPVDDRESILELITGGKSAISSSKTWFVESATLINSNGEIEISDLPNIKDDEFIFSTDGIEGELKGKLVWKKRMDININASLFSEVSNDSYLTEMESDFFLLEDKTIDGGGIELMANSQNQLEGTISFNETGNTRMEVILKEKGPDDYKKIQASLMFSELTVLDVNYPNGIGFASSYANNSLYYSYRDDPNRTENVLRFDLGSLNISSTSYPTSDFITKRINIIRDSVMIFGGSLVNAYPLDLTGDPISFPSGRTEPLTRFGNSSLNNEVYIVGGGLTSVDESFIIKKWNQSLKAYEDIGVLPEPRVTAQAEFVDSKLYIFGGGNSTFRDPAYSPVNSIFVYDLKTNLTETFSLPKKIQNTAAARYENLIFVGGRDEENTPFFGAFNTLDNTFTEIEMTNQNNDLSTFSYIYELAVLHDKIYAVLGNSNDSSTIFVANLSID